VGRVYDLLNKEFEMAFYKVVLNGQAYGQDIKNILYYRTGLGVDIAGLTVGGTVELANSVRAIIWPLMKQVLTDSYRLEDITASVYNDGTFDLVYQNPTTVQVGENGVRAGTLNGPATCAIVKFSLEPTMLIANGPKPPKRGYVAIGPLCDDQIGNGGSMVLDGLEDAKWTALCFALANNVVSLIPPAVFFPVRMHQDKVLGVFRFTSFADVRDAMVRNMASFRRSRMPEL
jgi:hypothetical protein